MLFIIGMMAGAVIMFVFFGQWFVQEKAEEYIRKLATGSGKGLSAEIEEDNKKKKKKTVSADEEDEGYKCPVDFEALQEVNPDIVAWAVIPNTTVEYPVLCATEEEGPDYYLRRNYKGDKDDHGSLYIETGESCNFDTRTTIIYGHNMKDGSMLGTLYGIYHIPERYNTSVYIYLPDRMIEGKLVACYETGTELLTEKYHGLQDAQDIFDYVSTFDNTTDLFKLIKSDIINRRFNLITLSTCAENGEKRLLAQYAVPADEIWPEGLEDY